VLLKNRLRELLETRFLSVGAFITMTDSAAVDVAGAAGYDFVLLDAEHAALTPETIANHVRAARARNLGTLVRVPEGDKGFIQRVLDAGVEGVEVPHVKTAADARWAVSAVRFPPEGSRGVFTKGVAANYGAHGYPTAGEAMAAINAQVVCNVIIEDVDGAENIDEIAAVPGVDFITFGVNDYSGSAGVPGQIDHPSVREAMEKVLAACRDENIPAHVTGASAPESVEAMRALGIKLVTSASDAMCLLSGMRADAQQSRRGADPS
jgi:4-hydroxy-2-oxoheptanedioate aldolase